MFEKSLDKKWKRVLHGELTNRKKRRKKKSTVIVVGTQMTTKQNRYTWGQCKAMAVLALNGVGQKTVVRNATTFRKIMRAYSHNTHCTYVYLLY